MPQSRVIHRQLAQTMPIVAGGEGPYLFDTAGKRYLDGSGGAAVSCLGHNHPAVVSALRRQIETIAFAHTGFFTSQPLERLADFLIERAPEPLGYVYFSSGGSEAMEAGLKIAHQYFQELGQGEQRKHFIARRQSYHGNTLGALSVGGNMWRRTRYAPILIETHHVAPCFAYRFQEPNETLEAYGQRAAHDLEAKILEVGPDTVIAFAAETVVGATAGAVPPAPGYFKRIREICDRYGILLILDEVMCGMGRTGHMYAFEEDGIVPDIVATAKGLGGGYQPIGAAIVSDKIVDAIRGGSGTFMHGHTYMGHTAACAAALAVQETIERDGLLAAVREKGAALRERLTARFGNHPHVGDIRGRGLFLGLELVADRGSKEPFDPGLKLAAKVQAAGMAHGLICYPTSGTIDGRRGDHVLLAPPFIVEDVHLDELVEKLDRALASAIETARVA